MKTALLVSTYNWPEALELVLLSIQNQSVLPDEIVIADDGSTSTTKRLIEGFQNTLPVDVKHIWHEDVGFTKTVILNKALKQIESSYIIQIDGDIILHKHFIKNHKSFAEKNTFLYGSRVSLKEDHSKKVLQHKITTFCWLNPGLMRKTRAIYAPWYNYFTKAQLQNSSKLRGCNMSYWKEDAFAINGYNEDFVGWGYEDFDFAQRLLNKGVYSKRIKQAMIQFHIYHNEAPKGNTAVGDAIQIKTAQQKIVRCTNGLEKLKVK